MTFSVCIPAEQTVPVHVYYRQSVGRFYYTTNPHEIGTTRKGAIGLYGFKYLGVAFRLSPTITEYGMVPLYRLYSKAGGYDYTSFEPDVNILLKNGYTFGGPLVRDGLKIIGYCHRAPESGTVPLYRYVRGHLPKHYTDSMYTTYDTPLVVNEVDINDYSYDGLVCFVYPQK